jgi:hypothetical protein
MRTSTTMRKKTAFQKLQGRKKAFCEGKATKADVKRAATAYVKEGIAKAVKSGKKAVEARKELETKAKRVLTKGCKISSNIAGKKKTATKRKSTVKRAVAVRKRK